MKISELQPKQSNVTIELDIVEKLPVREFQKFGKPGRVCTAIGSDGEKQAKVSLWNEQVDEINTGDRIRLENGYVNEWQGELQLTTGKFGKLLVLGKAEKATEVKDEKNEEMPAVDADVDEEPIE